PLSMVAVLNNYRQPAQRRSLAVFQINFSAQNPVAGFLTSNDLNGTINPVPITPQDVLIAADWVDLYLTHAKEWSVTLAMMENSKATVANTWHEIRRLNDDPFISENRLSSLLMRFRTKLNSDAAEMQSLASTDPDLHGTLSLFATQYDATTATFVQEFMGNIKDDR